MELRSSSASHSVRMTSDFNSPLLHSSGGQRFDDAERKAKILDQVEVAADVCRSDYFCNHDIKLWKQKGSEKITKYGDMGVWRTLISFPHTVIAESETWKLLGILTILCFITMALVLFVPFDGEGSIPESDVTNRVEFLLSFVLR
jgi:hypothetical protein